MAKPVVAIVGRPNVGKSTLFNKLIGERRSIVEDTPGVTRDRIYGETEWRGHKFTLIDTGGIEPKTDDIILSQVKLQAEIAVETRGETTEVNREVEAEAVRLCEAAAKQYGCTCEVRVMGAAGTAVCDPALAARTAEILERVEDVREVLGEVTLAIGEDITTIMERVQQRGGQATELIFAMPLAAPHHNGRFDVAEEVLGLAVRAVTELAMNIY